jgi:hypothetical protein
MSLKLLSNSTQVLSGVTMPITAVGGTAPYTYSVVGNGSIDSGGIYTSSYKVGKDTIKVIDSVGKNAILEVFTGTPLHLLCDIIQTQLELSPGRVFIWDQKIIMPTDFGMFVVVGESYVKPFGSANTFDGVNNSQIISTNCYAEAQIDLYSRGPEARDRKEEIILALASNYAEAQQELNAFYIARIPTSFTNLSTLEYDSGTAIPYRFTISVGLQYQVKKMVGASYYDNFNDPEIIENP